MNRRLKKIVDNRFIKVAQDLVNNPEGLKFKLLRAKEKLSKDSVKDALGNYWNEVTTLVRMLRAWKSKKYTDIAKQTIVYATVAVIYFLTPTDFVPDIILGLGFVDDMAVIKWVLDQIQKDLEKFKKWEKEHGGQEL